MNKQQLAAKIWESANKMRSKIEANEYKDYILGFIFYKFLSDKELEMLISEGWTKEDLKDCLTEEDDELLRHCQDKNGYFIAYETLDGCAKEVVASMKKAGVTMTGAGAPFPYGKDPKDSVIRIAPSCPSVENLKVATEIFVVCVKLAAIKKVMEEMNTATAEA